MGVSKIEWCDRVWNPVTGCSHSGSPGCDNCWAKRMAYRLQGRYGYPRGWASGEPEEDPFRVTFHPERLKEPLHWMKPSRIFVCSMGDILHDDVDGFWLSAIWSIIERCYWHTFLILTKRPERWQYLTPPLPLYKNLWLGVSIENQQTADKRISILLQIPAAKRFISVEPMLESINLGKLSDPNISWVICGGETGPKARPMHPDWVRSLREQCQTEGVPFFFKSWGTRPYPPNAEICKWFSAGYDPISKSKENRLLDGREWNEIPNGAQTGRTGESKLANP